MAIANPDHSSLAARLLEIQEHARPRKSSEWMHKLSCLRLSPHHKNVLQLIQCRSQCTQASAYVAVSYPWKRDPKYETNNSGRYHIVDHLGDYLGRSKVRDEVLQRAIQYAQHQEVDMIWIDQECIPQANSKERQAAMDHMDLVYRQSSCPVGILAVILENQREVNILQELLMGRLVELIDNDQPRLARVLHKPDTILLLLRRIFKDRWWTRAWIFQEEYLSSTAMDLLIRHRPGIKARKQFRVADTDNELCINASRFREQASLFLLALRRSPRINIKRRCKMLLKRFGKYNIQCLLQHDMARRAMSPRIFADLLRRDITNPFDLLPIAANSCDYNIRLDPGRLVASGHHLECCLLALYLLNGELLRNADSIKKLPSEMHLRNYVEYVSFNKFALPNEAKQLTYLKSCRLRDVTLCHRGILTRGHIWTIRETISTVGWRSHIHQWNRQHCGGRLTRFRRGCLALLATRLRARGSHTQRLASRIEGYMLSDEFPQCRSSRTHMDLMAESITEAIRTGSPLWVGGLQGSDEAGAIFTNVRASTKGVFTQWSVDVRKDGSSAQYHVSLGVSWRTDEHTPILTTTQWINGLAFFRDKYQVAAIFGWPDVWMKS